MQTSEKDSYKNKSTIAENIEAMLRTKSKDPFARIAPSLKSSHLGVKIKDCNSKNQY